MLIQKFCKLNRVYFKDDLILIIRIVFFLSNKTRLMNGRILLNAEGSTDLEKYTFSNALALSVKLATWEASLEQYVDSIEFVVEVYYFLFVFFIHGKNYFSYRSGFETCWSN